VRGGRIGAVSSRHAGGERAFSEPAARAGDDSVPLDATTALTVSGLCGTCRGIRMRGEHPILVVEDDNDVRDAMVQVLQSEGYAAIPAVDGRDALERIEDGLAPCVILLDLMMPRMDGWQFIEEHRRRRSKTPIIVVSAYGSSDRLRSAGVEYMRKPVDIDALLVLVGRYCERQ
jgi:two-component system, chemotaxis family, chemotaxis protein CheY